MTSRIPQWLSRYGPNILHWLCRIVLACIFIKSGDFKRQNWFDFALAIQKYQIFPEDQTKLIFLIARVFPWIEIALGLSFLLLIRRRIRYAAGAATALLLFFMVLLTITYIRGIDASCGCFSFDDKITPLTIGRDSLMLLPALYLLFADYWLRRHPKNTDPESAIQNPDSVIQQS